MTDPSAKSTNPPIAPATNTVNAVIFDLWGTLVPFPPSAATEIVRVMADALSVPADKFERAWSADFDRRVTGELSESLRRVCRILEIAPPEAVTAAALAGRELLHRACFTPRTDAVATLRALRARGCKIGLVTDCSSEIPQLWAESPLAPFVDVPVFSCAEGVKKPDPRIYERACARLAVTPYRCVFVGDGASNELSGAAAVGMRAIQLRTADNDPHPWQGERISALTEVLAKVTPGC